MPNNASPIERSAILLFGMEHRLLALGPGQSISFLDVLTAAEFGMYDEAIREVQRFHADDQMFDIFEANVEGVFEFCRQTVAAFAADKAMTAERMYRIATEANRHLLNVLTSLRTFLDHAETRLKRTYGKGSAEVAEFKRATSQEYDRRFAYRFLYRLRNYAQHCGLPVGRFSLGSEVLESAGEEPDPPTRETLAIYFAREQLLTDFDDWGNQVEQELRAGPRSIEITRLLRILDGSVKSIHTLLRKMSARRARPHARKLRSLVRRVERGRPGVQAALGHIIGEATPSRLRFRIRRLPFESIGELLDSNHLRKRARC